MEEIRLVIWDLDGVYWPGVLAEGSAAVEQSAGEIVRALNRRGIVNAICSKNDEAAVREVLEAQGMWGEFIFPSIGFGPKGGRVADIIEAAQLRPASVLFIDDEPANLAEAERAVPGLNVAGPGLAPELLENPRFRGSSDPELVRLRQYKLLESRSEARCAQGGGNEAFLRGSSITVRLVPDVEAHIGRAVELINRTNQVNFTKIRLPERTAEADLRAYLTRFDVFAGLIEVRDRYGDYGLAGFYAGIGGFGAGRLEHFCFSCRLLDLGVERWLYERLGRPGIEVKGPVVGTLEGPPVDWITERFGDADAANGAVIDRLVMRGGCDLSAMSHYLRGFTHELAVEFNTIRAGRQLRLDHAGFLPLALAPPTGAARAALEAIGYEAQDLASALAKPPAAREVWLFSFWTDAYVQLYERLSVAVPFLLENDTHAAVDVTALPEADAAPFLTAPENRAAWRALQRDFKAVGALTPVRFGALLAPLLAAAQNRALVIFMLTPEVWRNRPDQALIPFPREAALNDVLREAARANPDIVLVDMFDFAAPGWHGPETAHFDRATYCRAAEHIAGLITARFGAPKLAGS